MIVISPHLDDAVWSCMGILAEHRATVVTICAGIPPKKTPPSMFDERAGFATAQLAMKARRQEDINACRKLDAKTVHLSCLDCAYGDVDDKEIRAAVEKALAKADGPVIGPLGLRHPDHQRVATAFRRTARNNGLDAWVYEDLPYAYTWPEFLAPALMLAKCGEQTVTRRTDLSKRDAVETYRSQVNGSTHMDAILAPERYHHLNGDWTP